MVAESYEKCSNPACDNGDAEAKSPCEFTEKCANACAAYGKVCPCASRAAGRSACKAMQKLMENTKIFVEKPDYIKVNNEDLVIGKKLGEGGFSVVHEVTLKAGEEQGQTFAIKYLKRKVMVNQRLYELGAADLAIESMFLATLDHPHIIKYHGITSGSVETNVASGKECGFFILIDRLNDTLEKRIEKWAEEANEKRGGFLYRISHDYKVKLKETLNERLKVALQIAECMEYLHSLNIIYRDLKPENMAFDDQGVLKLFDLGLCTEIRPDEANKEGNYKLTGNTGSRRYMSPEVAKGIPYDKSVDAYSFGILLWELCAMEKPFFGYSANKHMQQVVIEGERPNLDTSHTSWWPVNLHWLLQRCWSSDPATRPNFTCIRETLEELIGCKRSIPQVVADKVTAAQKNVRAVATTEIHNAFGRPHETERGVSASRNDAIFGLPLDHRPEKALSPYGSHKDAPSKPTQGAFHGSLLSSQKPATPLAPSPAAFASLKPTESHDETHVMGRKRTFGFGRNRKYSHS
jgi:serine/threonine protein kinase